MARSSVTGALLAALVTVPAAAAPAPITMSETEVQAPAVPPLLSARDRAATENRILAQRLDTIIPAIMREQGIDLWLLVAREYFEEPVVASMLDAENMHARRRTILIFYDPGQGKPVERLTVSRYGPSIGFWDNQNAEPRGSGAIHANTAWSIELTSYAAVPEWGGQRVDFRSEENAFFDGKSLRFIDGRQTEMTLIR